MIKEAESKNEMSDTIY